MAVAPVLQTLALTERAKEGPDWAPESHNVDDSQDINGNRKRPGGEDLGLDGGSRLASAERGDSGGGDPARGGSHRVGTIGLLPRRFNSNFWVRQGRMTES